MFEKIMIGCFYDSNQSCEVTHCTLTFTHLSCLFHVTCHYPKRATNKIKTFPKKVFCVIIRYIEIWVEVLLHKFIKTSFHVLCAASLTFKHGGCETVSSFLLLDMILSSGGVTKDFKAEILPYLYSITAPHSFKP